MRKDTGYQEALVEQQKAFDKLDVLGLTVKQKKAIEHAISANNHVGAVYGEAAYRVGMEDGIRLRLEMEEIRGFS